MGVYVGDNLVAGNVGEVYTKAQVDTMIANAVALAEPVGSIKPFAGTTVPDGYLLCDGSAISRTTYAALFAVIGTTYGTGDGSTTFNLPNLYDRIPWGQGGAAGTSAIGSAPNIKGLFYTETCTVSASGAFYTGNNPYRGGGTTGNNNNQVNFSASRSSSCYSDDVSDIRPRRLYIPGYIIKY